MAWPRRLDWLPVFAILLIVASAASLVVMINQINVISGAVRANYWNTAQSETEFLRLKRSLELYVAGSDLVSHSDLVLRLDIFHSRIDAFQSTETQNLQTVESYQLLSDELGRLADRLDALILDPTFRDRPDGQEALSLMTNAWIPVHGWVRDLIHGELLDDERAGILGEQRTLIFVNLALLLISLAVMIGILRRDQKTMEMATRERHARIELEMAADARDRFVAGMSHELRTPLNAIVGFSDMLATGIHGDLRPRQAEYVKDISNSGQYLLSLINDILDYSKLEANMHEPEFAPVDVNVLVKDGLKLIEPTVLARGTRIVLVRPEEAAVFEADYRFALQSLVNLLSNAAKFSPPRGRIEVEVREARGAIEIVVRDEGPGMSDEQIASAFEPFRQFSDPYTANPAGTGLGLALTKSFCEILNARLVLRRAKPGGLEAIIAFGRHVGPPTTERASVKTRVAA